MQTPMQLSLRHLLKNDRWIATPVEHFVTIPARPGQKAKKYRKDLWGFADIIYCTGGGVIGFVQTTTLSNIASRVNKILENQNAIELLCRKVPITVHGWYQEKDADGKAKKGATWQVRERIIEL